MVRYSKHVRARAFRLWFNRSMTRQQIADKLRVPVTTLALWIDEGKWVARKAALEAEIDRNINAEIVGVLREKKVSVLRRETDLLDKLESRIEANLSTADHSDPKSVLVAARTFKNTADVASRLYGFGGAANPAGRTTLIQYGMHPEEEDDAAEDDPIDVTPDVRLLPDRQSKPCPF